MKPIDLILKGFIGIASGRGKPEIHLDLRSIPSDAALVALVGENGTGKTTIMDNLHPFRLMPSRASSLTPGGFSYWENVGQEATKELIWEHGGNLYQSILNFRQTGKTQKQECYLLIDVNGSFEPVKLPDGLESDGKTTSYDKCIEAILGKPEVYFVAAFAAQKRKTLSEMGATEIKSILSSVLGHEKYRELNAKALDIAKILKVSLTDIQLKIQDIYQVKQSLESIANQKAALLTESGVLASRIKDLNIKRDMTQRSIYELDAQLKTGASYDAQRSDLTTQLSKLDLELAAALKSFQEAYTRECFSTNQNRETLQNSIANIDKEELNQQTQLNSARDIVQSKETIDLAAKKAVELGSELAIIDASIAAAQAKLVEIKTLRDKQNTLTGKSSSLKAEGQSAKDKLEAITVTASLIDAVPCSGNAMQDSCQLLSQAKEAKQKVQELTRAIVLLRGQYKENNDSLIQVRESVVGLELIESEIKGMQSKRTSIADSLAQQNLIASKATLLKGAEETMAISQKRLSEIGPQKLDLSEKLLKTLQAIDSATKEFDHKIIGINADFSSRKLVYQAQLNALPKAFDMTVLTESKAAFEALEIQIANMTKESNGLLGNVGELDRQIAVAQDKIKSAAKLEASVEQFGKEIAHWSLIAKALGNDGLVALSIDDCGPEISGITNQILADCFGGRFTVRIDTQTETKQGALKETFEVMVNDCLRGEDKPASLVSGGEGVWINESLTRAIALYQAQKSGQSYQTLFSDEADGPLDPEKKRQFIQMKRAVLSLGGYEREYFISQTPELWEMADHIIDVGSL